MGRALDTSDHLPPPFWCSRGGAALLVVAAVGGLLLFTEHRAHILGFLLQCPTLMTLAMFRVLVVMYVRLAIAEERDSEAAFGEAWRV